MSNRRFWKTGVFALVMAFLLVTPIQAMDRHDGRCEKRIHKAEDELRRAERRHGEHSRQAHEKRRRLEEIREHCHHDHDRR